MANGCEREGTDAMVTRLRHELCRISEADLSHLGCQDRTGYFDEIIFSFTDHHCKRQSYIWRLKTNSNDAALLLKGH